MVRGSGDVQDRAQGAQHSCPPFTVGGEGLTYLRSQGAAQSGQRYIQSRHQRDNVPPHAALLSCCHCDSIPLRDVPVLCLCAHRRTGSAWSPENMALDT